MPTYTYSATSNNPETRPSTVITAPPEKPEGALTSNSMNTNPASRISNQINTYQGSLSIPCPENQSNAYSS